MIIEVHVHIKCHQQFSTILHTSFFVYWKLCQYEQIAVKCL